MKHSRWLFSAGATLVFAGVAMTAALERHSYYNTQDWEFRLLEALFLPSLLLGGLLSATGAVLDRRRLPAKQLRRRSMGCFLCSGGSLILLMAFGNVHGWTFTFFFPMVTAFISAMIFLI